MIRNIYWSACKIPAFPVKSEYNYNLLSIFSKNYQISNFMKIRPVRAEFLHVDGRIGGQTDMAKLTITLGNFANAPKNDRNNLPATRKKPCSEKNPRKVD